MDAQKPRDDQDTASVFLPDLIQTWSLAAEKSDESLLSAVPAVLALLVRTLSADIDLTAHGLRLGRTLLLKPQQELMARGLTSSKGKEFLISPVLRLLRELASLDGGVLAKAIFRARDLTFKGLARNLNLRYTGTGVEDLRKPSVRTNSVRFLLTAIRFLPSESKRELLNQRDLVSALTRDIKDDPPFVVRDVLETLKAHVLLDEALPRDAKSKLANTTVLGRISTLYRYDLLEEDVATGKKSIDDLAHEFLTLTCTSPKLGVLLRQSGFYPKGIDPNDSHDFNADESFIDLDIDSIEWMDKYTQKVPVRNAILSDFIQTLRPWSSLKQSELLLSIFKSAPELVADYFYGKKDFSFDPKLTATWIGYSAFLFSTLQLPLPPYFSHHEKYARLPPPPALVLENILPQPLSQKVLTRCLTLPHNSLITFFAIRILCVAFGKLQSALKMYQEAAKGAPAIWAKAADRLTDDFCQRCPSIKEVILVYRRLAKSDLMQREATTKLLVLYYEVVPRIALQAKFDVSGALAENLKAMEEASLTAEDRVLRSMELDNLFSFAHFSPGMRWFGKTEGSSLSPFMAMLKLAAEAPTDFPMLKLRSLLASIVKENQILQAETSISPLDLLILGLRDLKEGKPKIYTFLDDCVSRCGTKPMKYILDLEELSVEIYGSRDKPSPVSLLSLAIAEQWPFLVKNIDDTTLQAVAEFVAHHLAAATRIEEDKKIIKFLTKRIATDTPDTSPARKILEKSRKLVDSIAVPETTPQSQVPPNAMSIDMLEKKKVEIIEKMIDTSEGPAEDHTALVKWTTKELDEVIEDGHLAALISLLSSQHLSVRKEAVTNLAKFSAKLKESTFEEKDQIWLLVCELAETAKKVVDHEPLADIITSFASAAVSVLIDPLHCLYPKINDFLTKGPEWDIKKIPLMYKILDEAPSLDDSHYAEIGWLLTYMLAGLLTPADMAVFRKRQVFEKLLSVYNSPYLAGGLRDKILRIFFKATTIEGGSTTLITRASAMTWLQAQVALGCGMPLKVLMEQILESCDKSRVKVWSKGAKMDGMKDDTFRLK